VRVPISRQDRVNHWRALAADVDTAAVETTEPKARATLITIAALYDDLAIKAALTGEPTAFVAQPIRQPATKPRQA
jgi:hypothetical protein